MASATTLSLFIFHDPEAQWSLGRVFGVAVVRWCRGRNVRPPLTCLLAWSDWPEDWADGWAPLSLWPPGFSGPWSMTWCHVHCVLLIRASHRQVQHEKGIRCGSGTISRDQLWHSSRSCLVWRELETQRGEMICPECVTLLLQSILPPGSEAPCEWNFRNNAYECLHN